MVTRITCSKKKINGISEVSFFSFLSLIKRHRSELHSQNTLTAVTEISGNLPEVRNAVGYFFSPSHFPLQLKISLYTTKYNYVYKLQRKKKKKQQTKDGVVFTFDTLLFIKKQRMRIIAGIILRRHEAGRGQAVPPS